MATSSTQPSEKTKETVEYLLEDPNNLKEFIKCFNNLSPGNRQLRLEQYRPCIYVIVVNNPYFKINEKTVNLIKVGFTHSDTTPGSKNRMETVKNEIKSNLEAQAELKGYKVTVAIISVLAIDALDLRSFRDIEKDVREQIGYPLPKDIATKLSLPVITEWALTTQDNIRQIQEKKKAVLKEENLTTEIFETLQVENKSTFLLYEALNMTEEKLIEEIQKLSKESYIKKKVKEPAAEGAAPETPKGGNNDHLKKQPQQSSGSAKTPKGQKTAPKKPTKNEQ